MKKGWRIASFTVLILFVLFLSGYQLYNNLYVDVIPELNTSGLLPEETVEGYREKEELIEYMLYQLQNKNLDLALRGCAVEDVAEGFSLRSYVETTKSFEHLETLPTAEYEDKAYMEISNMRLAAEYITMLEKCMQILGGADEVRILNIVEDIPENPDGRYYMDRTDVCNTVGAIKVSEMRVSINVDGTNWEMRMTLGRFRKNWKILLFNYLDNYQSQEPDIRRGENSQQDYEYILETEELEKAVLPRNYYLVNDNGEDTPEILAQKFFVYLQRRDALSAMSYFDFGDVQAVPVENGDFLRKQSEAAIKIQEFYYRIFLHDNDEMNWIMQHLYDEAINLSSLLSAGSMIYTDLRNIEVTEQSENQVVCRLTYAYERQLFYMDLLLLHEDTWKIENISFP